MASRVRSNRRAKPTSRRTWISPRSRAAERAGARIHRPVAQGEFLRRLGIAERARMLKARATPTQGANIDAALARLTASGTTAMGELFQVMAFADPKLGSLPGFDS